MKQGKLNAYATILTGRPVMKSQEVTKTYIVNTSDAKKEQSSTIKVCTRNAGFNLWQWLKKE